MSRLRVSATVDGTRLERARTLTGARESQLLDAALAALLEKLLRRAGRIDAERWPEFCRAVAGVMAC